MRTYRIGLIVPSSNVTMETEIPALLRRREQHHAERFTFHSARMRMTQVTPEALAAMDVHSERCAVELADAECDALGYACLVAVMARGPGAHEQSERRLVHAAGDAIPVVTSAGALIDGVRTLGARRVAMITPYLPELTAKVVAYLAHAGIDVVDAISLGVADNRAVGRLDAAALVPLIDRLDLTRADALVLSACADAVPGRNPGRGRADRPACLTAATATTRALLDRLGLRADVPHGGALLRRDL
jgi:maleate isomerase